MNVALPYDPSGSNAVGSIPYGHDISLDQSPWRLSCPIAPSWLSETGRVQKNQTSQLSQFHIEHRGELLETTCNK